MKQSNKYPVSPTNFNGNWFSNTPRLFVVPLVLIMAFAGIAVAQLNKLNFVEAAKDPFAVKLESTRALEHRVLDLINVKRFENGKQPLAWVDAEANAARSHSSDMAANNYLSHADLAGVTMIGRAKEFHFNDWNLLGENIGWISGKGDPALRVVESWMNSKGHRSNILNRKFSESGIGIAISMDGKYYFTQVFVRRH